MECSFVTQIIFSALYSSTTDAKFRSLVNFNRD